MHKRRTLILYFKLIVLLSMPVMFSWSGTFAYGAPLPQMAPVNPAFQQYFQAGGTRTIQKSSEGQALGHIPSLLDLSHLKGQRITPAGSRFQQSGYVPVFDLRLQGKVTPVKDQGSCGSGWAFATYGSFESNSLTAETWDFSENHLKNTHGFDWGPCAGGNAYISTAYLTRWSGPARESDDPYNPNSGVSPSGLQPVKHVQEVLIVPGRSDSTANDGIKEAVMTYGGVDTSIFWDDASYNATNHSYYYTGSGVNHDVTIVGWDDNYSRTTFNTTPPGDGAFIIKNSWGAAWGENGYFYLSYYDSIVGSENFVFVSAESTVNYNRVYQYDPLGWTDSFGYPCDQVPDCTTGWFANVFTAATSENLAAVSFYTASANSPYEIYVYTNALGGPIGGSRAGSQTGTIPYPGYHTIKLNSAVPLTQGQKFSIVVKLTTPGYIYPIPAEDPQDNYSSQAAANAGESYISYDGSSWDDITDYSPNTNFCIKAFTGCPLPVWIQGTSSYYSSIQTGYDNASDGQTLEMQALTFTEPLVLQNSAAITLRGGFGCDYASNPVYTILNGSLTIKGGPVKIENLIVR